MRSQPPGVPGSLAALPPGVPAQLAAGPFRGTDAVRAGLLTRARLNGRTWRRLHRDVYVLASIPDDLRLRLRALALVLPPDAVFGGRTAAALHGVDLGGPAEPVDVLAPHRRGRDGPGYRLRRAELGDVDVVEVHGVRATSPLRTAFDLGRRAGAGRRELIEAVVALDGLARRGVTPGRLLAYGERPAHRGRRGLRGLRAVAGYGEPRSESAGETRLRMVLVLAGLPRPHAQVPVYGPDDRIVARVDLAYPDERLAVEYDGRQHRDTWVSDARRRNLLITAGWRLLTYTASDVFDAPDRIARQVRAALASVSGSGTAHPLPGVTWTVGGLDRGGVRA
ncbi:DUF559 domain-containing protein [Allonocardiopsis opalescens]|uniref:Uncharacterized protein DUF559 n=1 Tax=Allonocardiopsis opalescens TaxID=1144618 RepID=A0A2T0PXV5_9ACTN|nr:DUF559 domain-containing protein [Allonocardiopsis opalescens]PRX96288.1 uncharacterized protein DUF559 [Allonocardiopsis opalescens]